MNNETTKLLMIPAFHVELDNVHTLADSVARIQKGKGQYSYDDLCIFSEWVGMTSFQLMADEFEKDYQRKLILDDLNNYKLYVGKCAKTASVTNDLMMKAGIGFTWCSTMKICQNLLPHHLILAQFFPQEGKVDVAFDISHRQFYDTDQNGVLKEDNGDWAMRSARDVPHNMTATEEGFLMTEALLACGSTVFADREKAIYMQAFVQSTRDACEKFRPVEQEARLLFKEFDRDRVYAVDPEGPYGRYTMMPGEKGFELRAAQIFDYQKQLHRQ